MPAHTAATGPTADPAAASPRRGAAKPLAPPTASGSTGYTIVHATFSLLVAAAFAVEAPAGWHYPVFDGPAGVLSALPGSPWHTWAVIFAVPSLLALAGRGAPRTRYAVAGLAVAYAAFGVPALAAGVTRSVVACFGGLVVLHLSAVCWLTAAALARRWD